MTYRITGACLKCGVCVPRCPRGAIAERLTRSRGRLVNYTLHVTRIDPEKCDDCGVCVSEEYWCPARAIRKA